MEKSWALSPSHSPPPRKSRHAYTFKDPSRPKSYLFLFILNMCCRCITKV